MNSEDSAYHSDFMSDMTKLKWKLWEFRLILMASSPSPKETQKQKTLPCLSERLYLCSSTRSCLWNSEVRNGYCGHVRHATRADHEVHHPSGYGWYHRHLRASGSRTHR